MDLDKKKSKQTVIIEVKKGKVCKRQYRKKYNCKIPFYVFFLHLTVN